jgi:hypothetical protein
MHVKNSKLSAKALLFIAWLSFFIEAYFQQILEMAPAALKTPWSGPADPPTSYRICLKILGDFLIPGPRPFLYLRSADFFLILILNP